MKIMKKVVLFFVLLQGVLAFADDADDYEEEYIEESFETQLLNTLDNSPNLPDNYNVETGSLSQASMELKYIDFDFTDTSSVQKVMPKDNQQLVKSNKKSSSLNWPSLIVSSLTVAAGGIIAFYGNNKAKECYDEGLPSSRAELDEREDSAKKWQTARNVGYGIAALGGVGLIFTMAF